MLSVLTLENRERWDRTVRSFRQYDVYWLSGYVRGFQLHGDGEPLLFLYEDGGVRGMNVVMKRDIADCAHFRGRIEKGTLFDFATPYGYGGWLIEGEKTAGLFAAYGDWCRQNAVVSEFVRFHPMVKNHGACAGFYDVVRLGEVVHMDLASPETIWANLSSKNRNMIRKALKNGVQIYSGRTPELYETFRTIYNATMDKDDAEAYYYFEPEFYDSLLNDLPQNALVFYAVKDGKVIAASVMMAANRMMSYHLSGFLREYGTLAPTNLILYQAALWGAANGFESFYLGGGVGSREDSLFKFKRAFYRGELSRFYIGRKTFLPEEYDRLLAMQEPTDSGFFPQYRA